MHGKRCRSDVAWAERMYADFPLRLQPRMTDVRRSLAEDTEANHHRNYTVCPLLGIPVKAVTVSEFTDGLIAQSLVPSGTSHTPIFVTYLNAACSNIAADDPAYATILKAADCVYADGQAIVWAARYLDGNLPERVNAGDFIVEFCRAAVAQGLRIGLIGGRPGVAQKAVDAWRAHVPELIITGTWDGFFDDGGEAVADAVAASGTDILLVGMGVPLQEKWAWPRRDRLGVKVIWCVGALFEYYGEGRARAPVWVRRAGLEWLFRLALEPRRLWKRYLVGTVRFVWRVIWERRVALGKAS